MNNTKRHAAVVMLAASLACGTTVAVPALAPSGTAALPQANAAGYKSYVGTYVRKEKAGAATELGPAGTVQTVRTVKMAKIARGKVRFKVSTRYPLQKKTSKTGWITAKIKAGKATFSYKASRGERGKGTIALKSGKLKLKLKATKWAGYPSDTFKTLAFEKGTHVYSV